jgi:glycosyltransferase involved in cell wall biosynthesis
MLRIIYQILGIFFRKYDIIGTLGTDDIICISNFTRKNIRNIYGRDSRVHLIGIETSNSLFQNEDFKLKKILSIDDANAPIIFALGLTHHLKGEKELIQIFKKITEEIPNAVLLIGGWKTKMNEKIMRNIAYKLSIPQKNIIFCGFIKQELLDYFYRDSTLTAYTAIDESYGYIPLESMKNGTPVVAFEGGPSDTILDGQTGYIVENVNLDEFAQKSIQLLQDKSLHERFCENAKQHIKINFNLETSYLKLEEMFQEIIT